LQKELEMASVESNSVVKKLERKNQNLLKSINGLKKSFLKINDFLREMIEIYSKTEKKKDKKQKVK